LEDGVPFSGKLPDIPDLPEDRIWIDFNLQLVIEVPEGTKSLLIELAAEDPQKDFDFFVRFGEPVDHTPEGRIIADFGGMSPFGKEELGLWGENLKSGRYYIVLGTTSKVGGNFVLTAYLDGALVDLESGTAADVFLPGDDTPQDKRVSPDGQQYRFHVPADADSLYVRFESASTTQEVIIALRYNEPNLFTSDGLQTETIMDFAGGFEETCLGPGELLPGGDLYLWILNDSGGMVSGSLIVEVNGCTLPIKPGESHGGVARAIATAQANILGAQQYTVVVPTPPRELTITVTPHGDYDLDFFIRKGKSVEVDEQGGVVADFSAMESSLAPEVWLLECSDLTAGEMLYIVVANPNQVAIEYDIEVTAADTPCGVAPVQFRRGDVNNDGKRNVADAITTLGYLFGGQSVPCVNAADSNDDEKVNVADAIALLGYLFGGAGSLPAPFPDCGVDPTAPPQGDPPLSCEDYSCP